ncbi:MAG TPA: serine/threonine-protein kinase, partial [Polyangiaceae bacterium]|nr:serine/threonine-protein kinase [Polyangiaceae bacterium]
MANIAENAVEEAAPPTANGKHKYHVLMELGLGGMAVVEAAVARGLAGFSKVVVLKRPRREFASQPEAVSTFLNEARISARMNHPNVVQVNEVYEEDGLPVIVMEYLEGQSFAKLQQRYFEGAGGSLELGLSVLCRALEALDYAHTLTDFDGQALNLTHRDVSPHNIMVTYDGRVKLLDFGIAKLDTLDGKTKTGLIKGKIDYMSPEQVDGRQLDGRADVFAVGVMIWEVAAKKRMWSEQSQAAVIKRLVLQDIPDLGSVAGIDPELVRICRKATAADRDERYASARALLEDLHLFLEARHGIAPDASIARWISSACADLRSAARAQMDKRLAEYSESSTALRELSGQSSLGDPSSESSTRRRAPDTGAGNGYAMTAADEPHRSVPRWRWAVLAALVPAAMGLWWTGALDRHPGAEPAPTAPAAPPAQLPSSTATAQPPAAPIHLVLQAEPDAAVLYLDGERLPSNPFSTTRPRDTREHELVVKAEGFETLTRTLHMESDLELS